MLKGRSSAWAVVALLAAATQTTIAQPSLSFSTRGVPIPLAALRMTSGDYNGDHKLDVAVLTVAGTVAVLLGGGDGSFGVARDVIRDPAPATFVITADLNADGRLDLISTHQFASTVSVALGRGDGTFQLPVPYFCGGGPYGIVAADVNGDGILDLAVALMTGLVPSQAGTTVAVLLGRGNGTFGGPISSPVLGQRPMWLAAGDFNKDGRADLVVNAGTPDVTILTSKGDGTFRPPQAAPIVPGIYPSVAVADFNLDGRQDIVLMGGTRLYVLLGNGDGTFQLPQGSAFDGFSFVVADMNGDNVPDVAGASYPYNVALVLIGRGDGSFEDQQPYHLALGPNDVVAGDFNGDGSMDMVTCHQGQATLTALLNTTPVPVISANGVVNAASFLPGPLTVAPGEIVTIFGRNLGPGNLSYRPAQVAGTAGHSAGRDTGAIRWQRSATYLCAGRSGQRCCPLRCSGEADNATANSIRIFAFSRSSPSGGSGLAGDLHRRLIGRRASRCPQPGSNVQFCCPASRQGLNRHVLCNRRRADKSRGYRWQGCRSSTALARASGGGWNWKYRL